MTSGWRRSAAGLLLAAALAPSGCAREGGGGAPPPGPRGPYVLVGTLRDADTGEPVPRTGFYVHLFCDDLKYQHTLPASDAAEFRVGMPGPKVRIRVHDPSRFRALHEETVTLIPGENTLDVKLERTGFVLLRGRILDGATGRPMGRSASGGDPVPGGGPLFAFLCDDPPFSEHMVAPDGEGRYSLRVPRGRITIRVVDTALSPETPTVDLTGAAGDDREFDIVLR